MTNKELAELIFPDVEHDINYYEEMYPERTLKDGAVVSRFAPSPTGFVHMGSLLTAFIASKVPHDTNGVFYLRIEDTDQKRSVENGINGIIEDLKNFDIVPNEGVMSDSIETGKYGPYIQSKRLEIYHAYAKYMIENDMAYPCFATKEELDEMRELQEVGKFRIGYYGEYAVWRNKSNEEKAEMIKKNIPFVIRLKSKGDFNKKVLINDLVRGKIEFPENDMDIVIIKSDGLPPYHFAHVIDDHLMHTTHILRGEEWLSSTPVHIEMFKMLGFKVPSFAHLALVMKIDEDGSKRKLSKRKDPEAAVSFYHEKGIPIDAVKLYLMTIANSNFESWMDTNKDKTIDDFKFDFKKMSVSGSLFDLDKLLNISKNYISKLTAETVYENTLTWSREFDDKFYELLKKYKNEVIKIFAIERYQKKPRKDFAAYSDIKSSIWYMFDEMFDDKNYDLEENNLNKEILTDYIDNYYSDNDEESVWYDKIKDLAEKYNYAREVKEYRENPDKYNGHVGHICEMLRYAVTKEKMTPSLYQILQVLGENRIKLRINNIK